jgi:cobalt/nickel transport system permease protein
MGVLGAFLFAAQMINFSIPGTGSSGHLGGGLLLAVLLGPHAAFLAIASVLVVQALFFADGGLLALGCNIFNMGFIPAFIVYPLIYRNLAGKNPGQTRLTLALMISAIVVLQLGPLGVVLETFLSGISSLPFSAFLLLMQPIHLAIGFVEGLATVAVVSFVYKARPEMLAGAREVGPESCQSLRNLLIALFAAAIVTGGIVSLFASKKPDGLEWAIAKVAGKQELAGPHGKIHDMAASVQEKTAFMPDYSVKKSIGTKKQPEMKTAGSSVADLGTSVAGIVGALLTLGIALAAGAVLRKRPQQA